MSLLLRDRPIAVGSYSHKPDPSRAVPYSWRPRRATHHAARCSTKPPLLRSTSGHRTGPPPPSIPLHRAGRRDPFKAHRSPPPAAPFSRATFFPLLTPARHLLSPLLHLVQCQRRRIAAAPNFGHEHCRRLPHSVSHSPCASRPRFLMRTSPPPSPLAAGANLHRRLPPELSTPSKTSPPRPLLLPHRGLPLLVSFRRLVHAWQVPRPTLVLVVTAVRCASARAASI
jgi:hypothetical protein